MEPNRPLYLASIDEFDEKTGIFLISLVGEPAHEVEAVALNRETEFAQVKMSLNEDKMRLTGPVLIPEKRIYRNDNTEDGRDIMFTAPQIEVMRDKFHRQTGNLHLSNHNHVRSALVKANLAESWIIEDPIHDKAVALGYNLPVGTWMATYQVNDRDYWQNKVKTGEARGFSIEGFLRFNQTNLAAEQSREAQELAFYRQIIEDYIAQFHV